MMKIPQQPEIGAVKPHRFQAPPRTLEQYAALIMHAWHGLGHSGVRVWLTKKQGGARQEIRSNLVNGLPPRH